jgi:hypothetical protein
MNSTEKEIAKNEIVFLVGKVTSLTNTSIHAWNRANDGKSPQELIAYYEKKEVQCANNIESICKRFGIEVFWPGLYPAFKVNGYEEHSFESAILAALKLPRDFLIN